MLRIILIEKEKSKVLDKLTEELKALEARYENGEVPEVEYKKLLKEMTNKITEGKKSSDETVRLMKPLHRRTGVVHDLSHTLNPTHLVKI